MQFERPTNRSIVFLSKGISTFHDIYRAEMTNNRLSRYEVAKIFTKLSIFGFQGILKLEAYIILSVILLEGFVVLLSLMVSDKWENFFQGVRTVISYILIGAIFTLGIYITYRIRTLNRRK